MDRLTLLTLTMVLMGVMLEGTFAAEDRCQGRECTWNPWNPWSSCSKTCGEGTRTRTRGLCCKANEVGEFDLCRRNCNLTDESYETETCGFVCPAGNCTFQNVLDTGIEATDYQPLYGKDGLIINAPLHLLADRDFCKRSCLQANLQNGLFCWSYTYSAAEKCYLHFYKNPLTVIYPELEGTKPGESIFIRSCTERVACTSSQADVVFVVDSSGSIGYDNFEKVKVFLQGMINSLDIDPQLTRVGLMTFNDKPKWEFSLDQYDSKVEILKAIQRILYVVGGTVTSDALATVRQEGFVNNRTNVPMIAVVITDGLSRRPSLTRFQASLLRREGVQVYAIGVGNQTNSQEIFDIASSPEERFMYNFSTFNDLDSSLVKLDTNYVQCLDKTTTPTTPVVNTTYAVNDCYDKEGNCAVYGKDVCTDYEPWAKQNCKAYCGLCVVHTTPQPCEDLLPNCDSYGQYYCQNKEFVAWVTKNCRRYCGICTPDVVETTTVAVVTTTERICQDTVDNCESYESSCDDPKYRGFLEARCPAYCGFCQSHKTINATMVAGNICPEWHVPVECEMVQPDDNCCPLPDCPSTYVYTADMGRS